MQQNFSKKTSAHLTKTSVNFCDNIYDALKLFPFRQAYFYTLVNYLVQFVFEPLSYLNKNPKYVGTILWKFIHVQKQKKTKTLAFFVIYLQIDCSISFRLRYLQLCAKIELSINLENWISRNIDIAIKLKLILRLIHLLVKMKWILNICKYLNTYIPFH